MWSQAEQERSSIEALPWIWWGQGTRYWRTSLGEDQPSAHLDVQDIFGSNTPFRAGTVGTVAAKTAYGFVKGYERDYGSSTGTPKLSVWHGLPESGRLDNTRRSLLSNYMDVYDFTGPISSWQPRWLPVFLPISMRCAQARRSGTRWSTMIRKASGLVWHWSK